MDFNGIIDQNQFSSDSCRAVILHFFLFMWTQGTQVISKNTVALFFDVDLHSRKCYKPVLVSGLYTGFLPRGGEPGVCQKEGGRGCL